MGPAHIHVSTLSFLAFLAQLVLALFLLRGLAIQFPDSAFGKALGSIVA